MLLGFSPAAGALEPQPSAAAQTFFAAFESIIHVGLIFPVSVSGFNMLGQTSDTHVTTVTGSSADIKFFDGTVTGSLTPSEVASGTAPSEVASGTAPSEVASETAPSESALGTFRVSRKLM